MNQLDLVKAALAEDVGTGDVTTLAVVDRLRPAEAKIIQKADGVIFGLELVDATFRELDRETRVSHLVPEREWHGAGTEIAVFEGTARTLLTGERTALNFLAHLSGIASYTAELVKIVREINPSITVLDTRKTTPGLRQLEKAAVVAGGGANHRAGLYDAILIKENHIALAGGVARAVDLARRSRPDLALTVEVRNTDEIAEALDAGAPRLLLDNMTPGEIRVAVSQVDGRAELEVSGGITPATIRNYAEVEGIDYLSIGALTHSAPVLDLSMLIEFSV